MEKSIIKNGIDLYHGLSNEIPRIRNKNIPYVVTIHDLILRDFQEITEQLIEEFIILNINML